MELIVGESGPTSSGFALISTVYTCGSGGSRGAAMVVLVAAGRIGAGDSSDPNTPRHQT